MARVREFRVDVSEAVLDDLHRRLDATLWPPTVKGAGWDAGSERATVEALCHAWRHDFDWRRAEERINAHLQLLVEADDRVIHCIHVPGRGPDPLPLVLTHGWPSSFTEFLKVIGPLADPTSFGGDERDAFSVVVPSLPGCGWSTPPLRPGHGPVQIGEDWLELMTALGYERFAAHGSDWGAAVTIALGALAPDRVVGMHVTTPAIPPVGANEPEPTRSWVERVQAYRAVESGYVALQSTKPQTAAFGLTDSPSGLLAWIIEKWWRWSDIVDDSGRRDLRRAFTVEELLTNVMVYWVTRSIGSSMRLYYEAARTEPVTSFLPLRGVPLGVAAFNEVIRPPRELVAPHYDLRRWTEIGRGGHFPALENPDALVGEIRAFFADVASRSGAG